MPLTRSLAYIDVDLIDACNAENEPRMVVKASLIQGAGQGLFTLHDIPAYQPVLWYKGPVHHYSDCKNSDYCASKGGVWHVDGANVARYANDAHCSAFKNNARMEYMSKADGFAWPFLMSVRAIKADEEILFPYTDTYWRHRH